MTVYFGETFGSESVTHAVPAGWTTPVNNDHSAETAPSWGNGLAARGTLVTSGNSQITKTFPGGAAGNGSKVRVRTASTGATNKRGGAVIFNSAGTDCLGFLFHSDGTMIAYLTTGPTSTVIINPWVANTLYDIQVSIGAAGALSNCYVNGSLAAASLGVMGTSKTSISGAKFDAYNGNIASPTGYHWVDAVLVDTSTAIPNGTLAASGTLDGYTLGPDIYGGTLLGYTNGSSPASAVALLERSADGGSTWGAVGHGALGTTSGFLIWDPRPQYGSQPVAVGATATYRVTMMNASGDQVL